MKEARVTPVQPTTAPGIEPAGSRCASVYVHGCSSKKHDVADAAPVGKERPRPVEAVNTGCLPEFLSAGGLQPTRLAAWDRNMVFTASHGQLFSLKVTYPDSCSSSCTLGRRVGLADNTALASVSTSALPPVPGPRAAEFQSLALQAPALSACPTAPMLLAAAHSRSYVTLRRFTLDGTPTVSHVLRPDAELGDFPTAGWAGVAFHPTDAALLATVRAFSQSLSFLDLQTQSTIRTTQLQHMPSSLCYTLIGPSSSPVAVVTESSLFSVWDSRAGTCVAREQPLPLTTLHAVCAPSGGAGAELAVAGNDGVVMVYDVRTMKNRGRPWRSAVKHQVVGLNASVAVPGRVYVSGLENEIVACGGPVESSAQTRGKRKRKGNGGGTDTGAATEASSDGGAAGSESSKLPTKVSNAGPSATATPDAAMTGSSLHAPLPSTSRLHQSHSTAVKGDARWVGVTLPVNGMEGGADGGRSDAVFGLTDRGTLYVVLDAQHMQASM